MQWVITCKIYNIQNSIKMSSVYFVFYTLLPTAYEYIVFYFTLRFTFYPYLGQCNISLIKHVTRKCIPCWWLRVPAETFWNNFYVDILSQCNSRNKFLSVCCPPFQTDPGAHPATCTMGGYQVSFPGVKRQGRGVDHPPPSSAEIKERVELYLCSPSGPSWPVLGWTLPLAFYVYLCVVSCTQDV
jgi:hypothetical protein